MATAPDLDVLELTHLAIKAMGQGHDDKALDYLQRASAQDPGAAKPHLLMASLLASQAHIPEAIQAMARAVELDPDLEGARFQLGLLHFTSGHINEAAQAWHPFERADENHALRRFSRGLLHLAANRFDQCIADLEAGMTHCDSPALNKDMGKVIDRARAALATRG